MSKKNLKSKWFNNQKKMNVSVEKNENKIWWFFQFKVYNRFDFFMTENKIERF